MRAAFRAHAGQKTREAGRDIRYDIVDDREALLMAGVQMVTKTLAAVCTAALLMSCTNSPTGRSQLMLISPEAAIVQSKTAYLNTVSQLDQEDKLLDDPLVADRVRVITGRVVTAAIEAYPHTQDWEWSVAIIDDDETVNAWCMAGGRMAVYTGLLKQLALTDDEFAHIMGHEISHAVANHTAERMSRAMVTQLGILAVGVGTDSQAAMGTAALAAQLALELPNSRTAETEADVIGMKLATLAGYEPDGVVTLWQKMNALGGDRPPEFLSTHPAPASREQKLTSLLPEMRELNPQGVATAVHPVKIVAAD
jgi:predicted Zn-dependent protease